MRQIGTLADERQAQTFVDYLLTRGLKSKVEADNGEWAVWVFDEDNLKTAKEELVSFRADSGNEKYAKSREEASRIRDGLIKDARDAQKKNVDVRLRWERPVSSRCPVTTLMIVASVIVAFASNLGKEYDPVVKALSYASADNLGMYKLFRNENNDIRRGEVWRLVTPIFLHFTLMHIVFNMFWLRDLGMAIELRRGSLRYIGIVLSIAILSNTAQYLYSGPAFGGMSGVVFGLFGYTWMRSRYDPASGFYMSTNTIVFVMIFFALCVVGIFGSIANMAHAAGLGTGAVLGYAPIAWREWRRK